MCVARGSKVKRVQPVFPWPMIARPKDQGRSGGRVKLFSKRSIRSEMLLNATEALKQRLNRKLHGL